MKVCILYEKKSATKHCNMKVFFSVATLFHSLQRIKNNSLFFFYLVDRESVGPEYS